MIFTELKREFKPNILLPSLTTGLIAAIVTISMEISLAALIFSGDLREFLGGGICLMLFGAFVVGIVIALATSLPGTISVPQDTPAAILALISAAIAVTMKEAEPNAKYATLVAAITLTSLLTAFVYLLMGWFKASWFVRYIPYPVIGGFLAGTGWLLILGAFGVMTDVNLTFSTLPEIWQAVERLVEHVRTRPGAERLLVSHVKGAERVARFYEAIGFRHPNGARCRRRA